MPYIKPFWDAGPNCYVEDLPDIYIPERTMKRWRDKAKRLFLERDPHCSNCGCELDRDGSRPNGARLIAMRLLSCPDCVEVVKSMVATAPLPPDELWESTKKNRGHSIVDRRSSRKRQAVR